MASSHAIAVKELLEVEVQRFQDTFASYFPEEAFDLERVKYKKCFGDRSRYRQHIVVLYIPMDVKTNEMRGKVRDKRFAKFRAEKAWCICILEISSMTCKESILHDGYKACWYNKNQWSVPDMWDSNIQDVCTAGIHYFNHWLAAYYYGHIYCMSGVDVCFSESGSGAILEVRDKSVWYYSHGFIAYLMNTHFGITDICVI